MKKLAMPVLAALLAVSVTWPAMAQAPSPPPAGAGGKATENFATPSGSAIQVRTAGSAAEALFVEKCSMCHRQRGMGTVILSRRMEAAKAMLEQRSDLTAPLIAGVVRTGAGNMPRITRGEVSDEQLAVITGYLLRGKSP